jgi:hypothetical protein
MPPDSRRASRKGKTPPPVEVQKGIAHPKPPKSCAIPKPKFTPAENLRASLGHRCRGAANARTRTHNLSSVHPFSVPSPVCGVPPPPPVNTAPLGFLDQNKPKQLFQPPSAHGFFSPSTTRTRPELAWLNVWPLHELSRPKRSRSCPHPSIFPLPSMVGVAVPSPLTPGSLAGCLSGHYSGCRDTLSNYLSLAPPSAPPPQLAWVGVRPLLAWALSEPSLPYAFPQLPSLLSARVAHFSLNRIPPFPSSPYSWSGWVSGHYSGWFGSDSNRRYSKPRAGAGGEDGTSEGRSTALMSLL